ncbi:unnamed protein product [Pedinophyceae sp. YPF-701]|nr:unnamed protein product [Pedinophyceae sp. YPF-701]
MDGEAARKRRRLADAAEARLRHAGEEGATAPSGRPASPAQAPKASQRDGDGRAATPDAAFRLLRVRGAPGAAHATGGPPTCCLRHLVRGDLSYAFVSNYMIDLPWLLSACPALTRAGHLVVCHGHREDTSDAMVQVLRRLRMEHRTTLWQPPLPIRFGTHHSKFFLLRFKTGLRVVVLTANMIHADCNSKAQGVWYQDFPPKDPSARTGGQSGASEFETDLLAYLSRLGLPRGDWEDLQAVVRAHDMSSARAKLVTSVPGYHTGAERQRWGHLALRRALEELKGLPEEAVGTPLCMQASSMGSLSDVWLEREFGLTLRSGKTATRPLGKPSHGMGPVGMRIIWPTVAEVQNSLEGWVAGASIPGSSRNVNRGHLVPRFCRYAGAPVGLQRAMPHIKTYARHSEDGRRIFWLFLGSHNISMAAWGKLEKNSTQLMVRSYEMGVLLAPCFEEAYLKHPHAGFRCHPVPWERGAARRGVGGEVVMRPWDVRAAEAENAAPGTAWLPVPYPLPPRPYGEADEPWVVDEPREYPDVCAQMWPCEFSHYGFVDSDSDTGTDDDDGPEIVRAAPGSAQRRPPAAAGEAEVVVSSDSDSDVVVVGSQP